MNQKKLHVWVVHQEAQGTITADGSLVKEQDHRVLTSYLDEDTAQMHAHGLMAKHEGPYVAATKHTVRGKRADLIVKLLEAWDSTEEGHAMMVFKSGGKPVPVGGAK